MKIFPILYLTICIILTVLSNLFGWGKLTVDQFYVYVIVTSISYTSNYFIISSFRFSYKFKQYRYFLPTSTTNQSLYLKELWSCFVRVEFLIIFFSFLGFTVLNFLDTITFSSLLKLTVASVVQLLITLALIIFLRFIIGQEKAQANKFLTYGYLLGFVYLIQINTLIYADKFEIEGFKTFIVQYNPLNCVYFSTLAQNNFVALTIYFLPVAFIYICFMTIKGNEI